MLYIQITLYEWFKQLLITVVILIFVSPKQSLVNS